jgi:hypothetical protein
MKKAYCIAVLTIIMMITAGVAMAGSVNIGLGRMDQADFEALQQMVKGYYHPSASVSTPIPETSQVAEFNRTLVDAIRQAMATPEPAPITTASKPKNTMVEIGTGSMQTNEFCDLDKRVARNTIGTKAGFAYLCQNLSN